MAYEKTEWENGQGAPINADNLNKIEQGIEDAHNDISSLDSRLDSLENNSYVSESSFILKKWIPFELQNVGVPQNSYKDLDVPIEQGRIFPCIVAGVKINNSSYANNGQNGGGVICSWAMITSSSNLKIRFRNVTNSPAVIQAQISLLYLSFTPRIQ